MRTRFRPSVNLMRWFTPGLHVKRWLGLLFFAIVMISLAAGYILRDLYSAQITFPSWVGDVTLQFLPRLVRALLFALVGVGLIMLCFYKLSQSILGPFLPGRGTTERGLADRLYKFRYLAKGPRVVAIGGGTGLSALLRGIKKYTGNIVAIVTVADDGGSSGRLREEYRVLPPGDFRQCLTALAETEPLMTALFQYRFHQGSLDGHSFGNLFIMAMAEVTGSFERALRESGRVLAVRGALIPSTLHDVTLVASVNGSVVEGESKIPKQNGPISRVFLKPDEVELNPEAALAIMNAELLVVGPGSLYTSILSDRK